MSEKTVTTLEVRRQEVINAAKRLSDHANEFEGIISDEYLDRLYCAVDCLKQEEADAGI